MFLTVCGAVAIGVILGLLGSGGSIVTVPVLVYLVGQPEKVAIAGSLLVVGTVSLVGSIPYARMGSVRWRSVALFGFPGMAGTAAGAFVSRWITGATQLTIFAGVMLLTAWFMMRKRPTQPSLTVQPPWVIGLEGFGVGTLTGIVGVGGGFLIVPALVLLGALPLAEAIGTSLVIIAMQSLSGFLSYLSVLKRLSLSLDFGILLLFIGLGIVGTFIGSALGRRLPKETLRRVFGGVLIVVAGAILAKRFA